MINDVLRYVCISVQIAVLLFVLHRAFRLVRQGNRSMPAVFFAFATATFLVSDLYWLAFVLLKQDARLPFMPSDVADNGVLLLMGSIVASAFRGRKEKTTALVVAAAAFALVNVALWIAWSGEWVKDVIGALPFAYLVYFAARGMKLSGALRRWEWTALGVGCAVLIAIEIAMLFCPKPLYTALDAVCNALLSAGTALLFWESIRALRSGADAERSISLAVAAEAWCLCFMYMSAEPVWFAADMLCTAAFMLMLRAVERQVGGA